VVLRSHDVHRWWPGRRRPLFDARLVAFRRGNMSRTWRVQSGHLDYVSRPDMGKHEASQSAIALMQAVVAAAALLRTQDIRRAVRHTWAPTEDGACTRSLCGRPARSAPRLIYRAQTISSSAWSFDGTRIIFEGREGLKIVQTTNGTAPVERSCTASDGMCTLVRPTPGTCWWADFDWAARIRVDALSLFKTPHPRLSA